MIILKENDLYKLIHHTKEIANFNCYLEKNNAHITFLYFEIKYIDAILLYLIKILRNKMYQNVSFKVENTNGLQNFLKLLLQKEIKKIQLYQNTLLISLKLNDCKYKNVKIIPLWLGPRRKWIGDFVQDTYDLTKFILFNEIKLDKGIQCDTKIILNTPYDKNTQEKTQYIKNIIYKYHQKKTRNGTITVEERENIGISYGAFIYAFQKYKNIYDFWTFNEDDYIIDTPNYMLNNYNQFKIIENNIGFIADIGVCSNFPVTPYPIHAHCALGLTSQQILSQLNKPSFMLSQSDTAINHHLFSEIPFTNNIYQLGYDLVHSTNFNCTIAWNEIWIEKEKIKSYDNNMRSVKLKPFNSKPIT